MGVKMKTVNKLILMIFCLFIAAAFAGTSFADGGSDFPNYSAYGGGDIDWYTEDTGAIYSKDWTKEQVIEFINRPWTKKEKEDLLGPAELGYILDKKVFRSLE